MSLLIIDLGGQYCHLIKRTLSDYNISAEIRGPWVTPEIARTYQGIILSGGPQSVYEANASTIDPDLLGLGLPILGICYGHQLLAKMLGGMVEPTASEYGPTMIMFVHRLPLFAAFQQNAKVWMSHGDSVTRLPEGFVLNAMSFDCPIVAFSDPRRKFFGVQFHPEVVHTEHGASVLKHFADLCGVAPQAAVDHIEQITARIREFVGDRKVFFFVSGGVDSTVAFALCAKALQPDQLLAVYVDTGFMRRNDINDLLDCFDRIGFSDRLKVIDRSNQFMTALQGVVDPEEKREIVGRLFVETQSDVLSKLDGDWLLGQGTIYPDTIETGGKIKTHHNQCAEVQDMIRQGRVIEPLRELYKDQVREIGHQLAIPKYFVDRWPFPGPGLAIRCLASITAGPVIAVDAGDDYLAYRLPLRSVGVQGDARSYRTTMMVSGPLNKKLLAELSHRFQHDRIILQLGGPDLAKGHVIRATITPTRTELLRNADYIIQTEMLGREILVWQFPVVLIPLSFEGGESIVLRPVGSRDGMTANFVIPPHEILDGIVTRVMAIGGIDAVFLDVSDKPPATIEWE